MKGKDRGLGGEYENNTRACTSEAIYMPEANGQQSKSYLQGQVVDHASDTKPYQQQIGYGKGPDSIGELLDLTVARFAWLCFLFTPRKVKGSSQIPLVHQAPAPVEHLFIGGF